MGAEKKSLLSKLMTNMLTRKTLVTLVHNRAGTQQQNIFHYFNETLKKIVGRSSHKKDCYLLEMKKKPLASPHISPPPLLDI